ncbi:hypothetical protein Emag_005800 [Eimeria magna]
MLRATVFPQDDAAARQQQQQQQQQQRQLPQQPKQEQQQPPPLPIVERGSSRISRINSSSSNSSSSSSSSQLWFACTVCGLLCLAAGFAVCVAAVAVQPLQREFAGEFVGGVRCRFIWALEMPPLDMPPLYSLDGAHRLSCSLPGEMVLLGRALQGCFLAVGVVASFTFAAEVAPPKLRGSFVAFQELLQCSGCFVPYLIAWALPDLGWRALVGTAICIVLIPLLCLPLVPESPRFLLLQGKTSEAEAAMVSLGYTLAHRQQLLQSVQQQQQQQQQEEEGQQQQQGEEQHQGEQHQEVELQQQQQKQQQQQQQHQQQQDGDDLETQAEFPLSMQPVSVSTQGCVYTSTPKAAATAAATTAGAAAAAVEVPQRNRRQQLQHCCSPLMLAAALGVAHSLLAANSVIVFASNTLLVLGVCNNRVLGAFVGLAKDLGFRLAGAMASLSVADRVGRRFLLLSGAGCIFATHACLAIIGLIRRFVLPTGLLHLCTDLERAGVSAAAAEAAAAAAASVYTPQQQLLAAATSACSSILLLLMIFAWGATWASIVPVVAAELMPASRRALGVGLANALGWIVGAFFQLLAEPAMMYLGCDVCFSTFAILSAISFFFCFYLLPESRGMELASKPAGHKVYVHPKSSALMA